jgi:serine/threonine-protein kinase BUR1
VHHDIVILAKADSFVSEVHRARSKKTGALVALKKIIMHNEKDGVGSLRSAVLAHST